MMEKELKVGNATIDFVRHASVRLKLDGKIIYIDPWQLPGNPGKADIILVTHEHFDHFSPDAIAKISMPSTEIITSKRCSSRFKGVQGISISGAAAYNIGKKFHPRGLCIAFIIDCGNNARLYHAADTDFIPEMKELPGIDVAMLPIGGTYTMDIDEAVQAAQAIHPKKVVPIHYNVLDDTIADIGEFRKKCPVETSIFYE